MHVHVRWKNLEVSEPIRAHAERTVAGALAAFHDRVASVRIDLADVTGTRGSADKVCRIQVRGDRACEIIVTDTDHDVYVAIDRAAGRALQSIANLLERGPGVEPEASVVGAIPLNGATSGHAY